MIRRAKMTERITIRLNEELQQLLSKIRNKGIYNLSALVREALRDKLGVLLSIDNSSQHGFLGKGEVNNETSNI